MRNDNIESICACIYYELFGSLQTKHSSIRRSRNQSNANIIQRGFYTNTHDSFQSRDFQTEIMKEHSIWRNRLRRENRVLYPIGNDGSLWSKSWKLGARI